MGTNTPLSPYVSPGLEVVIWHGPNFSVVICLSSSFVPSVENMPLLRWLLLVCVISSFIIVKGRNCRYFTLSSAHHLRISYYVNFLGRISKGQLKSEWIYEIINFPKYDPKNLKDFYPMYYRNSQGRNPSNFSGHFWFKWKMKNFLLRFTDL